MTRAAWHFSVDVVLFVAFVTLLASSALIEFVFPPGTKAAGWSVWSIGYDQWSRIRSISLAAFTLMALIHLILQWSWVCNFITARMHRGDGRKIKLPDGIKTIYGVALLIVVIGGISGMLAVAAVMVKSPQ